MQASVFDFYVCAGSKYYLASSTDLLGTVRSTKPVAFIVFSDPNIFSLFIDEEEYTGYLTNKVNDKYDVVITKKNGQILQKQILGSGRTGSMAVNCIWDIPKLIKGNFSTSN